jgi:hypothetical protein
VTAGASPVAVAAAAGAPARLLRQLLEDAATTLPPRLATRLRALSSAEVAGWVRPGSRGRVASRATEPVDAAPTHALLGALAAAGWTRLQIAAELGYRGTDSAKGAHSTHVTAAAAHAVALLHRDAQAGLPPPQRVRRKPGPSRRVA